MNTILLQPADVLFFRDGRPMGGASAGHGAAWPLPTVVDHAFHAALHRAGEVFENAHSHRRGRSGVYSDAPEHRDRRFGSLVTAGPFPVCTNGPDDTWFFPRPADADDTGAIFLRPYRIDAPSSLPAPCHYPVVANKPPSKEVAIPWWSEGAWNAYLGSRQRTELSSRPFRKHDRDFADGEHTYGIGIDSETGSVVEGQFYSANYLRLRDGWKLGVLATAADQEFNHADYGNDLIRALFNGGDCEIIAGGQQRVCTATIESNEGERLPLPIGAEINGTRVKWILLTPAIWPEINDHSGGWLPSWIRQADGQVMLKNGDTARREGEGREAWRKRVAAMDSIDANLVAAIVGKPIPVTGYALPHEAAARPEGGAKSSHLAVPAGAVYYFEAGSQDAARALAAALNWHGRETNPASIKNRRSTLMGEKGFGLGVCGTWSYYEGGGAA